MEATLFMKSFQNYYVMWCVPLWKRAIRKEPSYYVERTSGWIGFRAIYSLFRAFCHQGSICFHAIFMSPPVAKSSLPLSWRICKWGPRDWETQCSKVDLCSFWEHSAVERLLGPRGLYFHQQPRCTEAELHSHQREGRKRKIALCLKDYLQFAPQIIGEKKQAVTCKIEFWNDLYPSTLRNATHFILKLGRPNQFRVRAWWGWEL